MIQSTSNPLAETNLAAAPEAVQIAQAPQAAGMEAGSAAASGARALGNLSQATPGVEIIRDGQSIPVQGSAPLLVGDRVVVPEGGQAAVTFPGPGGSPSPLSGVLTGGSDATFSTTRLPSGMEQVTVDVAQGDLIVQSDDSSDAAALMVKKSVPALAGGMSLGDFALGALGVGALAALLDDDDDAPADGGTGQPPASDDGGNGGNGGNGG
ncbi:MAG: hypothetical protein WCS60_06840, partial [Hydrogenophaga sp.]